MFFVKSEEKFSLCPNCGCSLEYHSKTRRSLRDIHAKKQIYEIRVLKCNNKACPTNYHRELPDIMIPYMRFDADSIEEALTKDKEEISVYADESTIYRWRSWFKKNAIYIIMALLSVVMVIGGGGNEKIFSLAIQKQNPKNLIKTIKSIITREVAWLSESVRILVNSARWIF